MQLRFLPFYFLIFITVSCTSAPAEENVPEQFNKYFDLTGYFTEQVKILSDNKTPLEKFVLLNGESEVQKLDSVDYESELKIFTDADINKPAWSDKYEIDSIFSTKNKLQRIVYNRLDKDLKTEQIIISLQENQQVDSIEILNSIERTMMKVNQKLVYIPGQQYFIFNREKLPFSEENEIKMEGKFLND